MFVSRFADVKYFIETVTQTNDYLSLEIPGFDKITSSINVSSIQETF